MDAVHLVEYNGEIIEATVTNKSSVARHWLKSTASTLSSETDKLGTSYRIVGLDCKYVRHPIDSKSDKIATLQLCFDTRCLVLQLLHIDGSSININPDLYDFLGNPRTTFVGVEIKENSRKLLEEYGLGVDRRVDLRYLAKRWFPVSYRGRLSLRALAYGVLGLSKRNKSGRGRDWDSIELDHELVEQACIDAYVCYGIAQKLLQND